MFSKSVSSIMGDFGKKITQLKAVQTRENKLVSSRLKQIKVLTGDNYTSQTEISAAQKAINALENFI